MKTIRKIKGTFQLFRIELPLAAGLCVLAGALIATGDISNPIRLLLGFLVGFFLSSAALIFNDYFDVESDKINAPHRPLPSGAVTRTDVLILTALTTSIGLVAAFLISSLAFAVAILFWVIGVLYNWRLKETGLLGNLLVSSSVAITFIVGGITVNQPWNTTVWFFSSIVFFIDLGEEIASGAMDLEGDKKRKSHSLALIKGKRIAIQTACTLFFLVILISSIPFLLHWFGTSYLLMILLMDTIIVLSIILLFRSTTPQQGRRALRFIYLGATLSLLTFLIGQFFT
jgi:geranylgeranylglycerol-phosphate geranylgeranyltransferase